MLNSKASAVIMPGLLAITVLASAGCASSDGAAARVRSADAVVGKVWHWESMVTPVEKIDVPAPDRYTLQLLADGKVTARFDCNRGFGAYTIAEGKITFSPMASTRAACEPGSLGDRFGRDLGRATSFFVEGGRLFLELPMDSGTMRFRPAD